MELASRAFDTLAVKSGDAMEATFKEVIGFDDAPMAKARQLVRLAGLLHDVGHASFSHAAEKVVNQGVGHEALTLLIVRGDEFLGAEIDSRFWSGCADLVADVIEGGRSLPPQLQLLHDLISGQMDADRTDYLLRDSHHCGVDYGRFDHRRMIESLELVDDPLGGLEVAINRDGIHTFEALILARYQMNTQVYYHRLRRIYDYYLIEYHKSLGDDVADTPGKVVAQNDITMMGQIMRDASEGDGARKDWARRIANREHHRVVHDTGDNANARDLRRSKRVLSMLQEQFPERHFVWDLAEANIHKLLTPEDQEDKDLVDMQVVSAGKPYGYVGVDSQILSKIPRKFQCARIYADVSRDEKELKEEMIAFGEEAWKERGGR